MDDEKVRITISLDRRILDIIDKQRGSVKRSTYINDILRHYFSPNPPEETTGGTFVTTLELKKTLKNIHEKLKVLDALIYNVQDLEAVVYSALLKPKKAGKRRAFVEEIKRGGIREILAMKAAEERVKAWIDDVLKKRGGVSVSRDFAEYCKIEGVKKTKDMLRKYLKSMGLRYDPKNKCWRR